jgi:arginine/lysine/ornithine decarboxylase
VLLTSPNYLGLTADLAALSRCAKTHGALLLVDAAHGAHFPFSEALPPGAAGSADMWAHSQHKTLNALTQAASLHLGDCRIPPARVLRALAMVETTSPSYLLMASIDWSVHMARRQNWTAQVRRCLALEREIAEMPGLSVLPEHMGAGIAARDHTRLVIDVSGRGLSGYEAQAMLEKDGIFMEMADSRRLVLITTPSDDPSWYPRLMQALGRLPRARGCVEPLPPVYAQGAARLPIREAVFCRQQSLPLDEAPGRIAGEPFGVYPPGVAACMPGEGITRPLVEGLRLAGERGAAFFGIRGGCVSVVED